MFLVNHFRAEGAPEPEKDQANDLQSLINKKIKEGVIREDAWRNLMAALCIDDTEISIKFTMEDIENGNLERLCKLITDSLLQWCYATRTFIAADKCEAVILSHFSQPHDSTITSQSQSPAAFGSSSAARRDLEKKVAGFLSLAGKKIEVKESIKLFGFPVASDIEKAYRTSCRQKIWFAMAIVRETLRRGASTIRTSEHKLIPQYVALSSIRHLLCPMICFDPDGVSEIMQQVAKKLLACYGIDDSEASTLRRLLERKKLHDVSDSELLFSGILQDPGWKENMFRTVRK
eukprot:GSA120T00020319001.1